MRAVAELLRPQGSALARRRPSLSAPAPLLNGRPDLSGLWEAERTPVREFVRVLGPRAPEIQVDLNEVTRHVINVFWDVKPGEQPLRPEATAVTRTAAEERP